MILRIPLLVALGLTAFTALQADEKLGLMTSEDSLSIKDIGNSANRYIPWSPSFTPDGKTIIFMLWEWDKQGNRIVSHIHQVNIQGGPVTQLTRGEKGESSPQVSPDGRWLAFLADRGKENQIWLLPLGGGEAQQLTEEGVTQFQWSPEGKRIAYLTRDSLPNKEEVDKKKKEQFDAVVVDRNVLWSHLWAIDTASRVKNRLTQGPFNASDPRWSPDGTRIVFVASFIPWQESKWKHTDDNGNQDIYLISAEGGTPENLTPNPGQDSNPEWSPDGTRIAYLANTDTLSWIGRVDLMVLDLRSRQSLNLTSRETDPISNPAWSQDGSRLLFTLGKSVYTNVYSMPATGGKIQPITSDLGIIESLDSSFRISPGGTLIAYRTNESQKPPDLWIAGIDGNGAHPLTDINPQIRRFAIAETRAVRWKSADGKEVEGILTLPVGYIEGKRVPLILQIHGGPYGRSKYGFHSRNQIFAAHGYALLEPNPRGSTGYGYDFTRANRGDWGGADLQADDMTGVNHVVRLGIADPEKLLVMGASYGGFSTFMAVTQTDRFKAAAGHVGVCDWSSFYGTSPVPRLVEYAFLGTPWEQVSLYRKHSPITYVSQVKTPLLITHAEEDMSVTIAQAELFYTALKRLGVEVEFVRYPREDHGWGNEPNHYMDLVNRQLEWFDRHLGSVRE